MHALQSSGVCELSITFKKQEIEMDIGSVVGGAIANSMGDIDIAKIVKEQVASKLEGLGIVNILIAGRSGSGKSTLINSVFEEDVAATGVGKPVTQATKKYTKQGAPVGIYDTKGLELKDYKPILEELTKHVEETNKNVDAKDHIHVAWICIAEGSRRVEEAEVLLAKQLADYMPVVVVITTATSDNGFSAAVKAEFPFAANVVRVNSVESRLDDDVVVPVKGLKELVSLTADLIPEGQQRAFAAAQKVSMELKVAQANKYVVMAAASAGAIGATPIPFSDALSLIPVQIGMLAGISAAFGLKLDEAFLGSLVAGTFTASAGSAAGKALVGSLLKMVPGVGSVVGGVISGAVAATLTTTFGKSYIGVLRLLLEESPDKELTGEEVAKAFKEKLG
jgi:uncharacterized protein (DUF697 family)